MLKQNDLQIICSLRGKFTFKLEYLNNFEIRTFPIDITFIIFIKNLSLAMSILECLLFFLKFLTFYKQRSNIKSNDLITNLLKSKVNF